MPQIWMTYDELAGLLNCDWADARAYAAGTGLDRRKSRDGQTRAKLTSPLTEMFLDVILRERLEREISVCVQDLKAMHELMAKPPAGPLTFRAANG